MQWQQTKFEFPLPIRYHLSSSRSSGGVAILLHGYQDHAGSMLKRLGWDSAELPFQILAINAPFPVPIWTAEGFKEAYSWYFRDTSKNLLYVSPTTTADRLSRLIWDLGLEDVPKVYFGFSQGGYLAPYIATLTKNTRGIIGFGCGFIEEAYAVLKALPVYGLHGDKDERITLEKSKAEYDKLRAKGFGGEFRVLPGVGHKIDSQVENQVRQLVVQCLEGSN